MSHRPKKILLAFGTALLALCASVALATPALADELPFGCLVFASADEIDDIVTMSDGVVTVTGGTDETAITVTQDPTADVTADVTAIHIGDDTADFPGSITFSGIASETDAESAHPLNILVAGTSDGTVTIDDCRLVGSETGTPTVQVLGAADITLHIANSTIQGTAGVDGSQDPAGVGVSILGDSTLMVSGETYVLGGTGGAAASAAVAPGAGGAAIYAPQSTLSMTNGLLFAKAGDTGTGSEVAPAQLPVGLTVADYELSNGTGINGGGPDITAIGWPQENATDLDLSDIDAGDPAEGTFYPWLLQVSTSKANPGQHPYVMDFAGSGNSEPIKRSGWTWFNIAPHEVQGFEVEAANNALREDDTPADSHYIWNCVNPFIGEPSLMYQFVVMPTFGIEGLEDWQTINGASVPQSAVSADAVEWHQVDDPDYGPDDWFSLKPGFDGTELAVQGTATLPREFTMLYPDLAASFDNTIGVIDVKAVYRLYNPYEKFHLYTTDVDEVSANVSAGWNNEHAYWYSPAQPAANDMVIRRLYNPYNGDHYFIEATNVEGIEYLKGLGWQEDSASADIVSLPDSSANLAVQTLFNPFRTVDTHLYTPLQSEVDACVDAGWELNQTIIWAYPFTTVYPLGY